MVWSCDKSGPVKAHRLIHREREREPAITPPAFFSLISELRGFFHLATAETEEMISS